MIVIPFYKMTIAELMHIYNWGHVEILMNKTFNFKTNL